MNHYLKLTVTLEPVPGATGGLPVTTKYEETIAVKLFDTTRDLELAPDASDEERREVIIEIFEGDAHCVARPFQEMAERMGTVVIGGE